MRAAVINILHPIPLEISSVMFQRITLWFHIPYIPMSTPPLHIYKYLRFTPIRQRKQTSILLFRPSSFTDWGPNTVNKQFNVNKTTCTCSRARWRAKNALTPLQSWIANVVSPAIVNNNKCNCTNLVLSCSHLTDNWSICAVLLNRVSPRGDELMRETSVEV